MEYKFEHKEEIPKIPNEILESFKSISTNQLIEDCNFDVDNINYALRICPSKNVYGNANGEPGEYVLQPNEWAVYIWEDLPENIQRVILFHEIIEIYFRDKHGLDQTPAHNATLPYEEEFKNKFLSDEEKKQIQELRKNYSI